MKRFLLVAALSILTLSGCDTLRGFFGMPTHENPVVSVTNNQISVSPDPLMFTRPPVCGSYVPLSAAVSSTREGKTVYFCSEDCRTRFKP